MTYFGCSDFRRNRFHSHANKFHYICRTFFPYNIYCKEMSSLIRTFRGYILWNKSLTVS